MGCQNAVVGAQVELSSIRPIVNNDPILAIRFPEDGRCRARTVVTRSRARPTGKYPSWKMGRMLQWESPHELNAFRLLDADPTIPFFQEQPAEIEFIFDGEIRRHYPDILVLMASGREFWEIKADRASVDGETADRTQLLSAALPRHGYSYRLVLGADLAKGPRIANALTLLRYGRDSLTAVEHERVRRLFRGAQVTWGDVLHGVLGERGRRQICRLALEGVISFDVGTPLTDETPLRWAPSAEK